MIRLFHSRRAGGIRAGGNPGFPARFRFNGFYELFNSVIVSFNYNITLLYTMAKITLGLVYGYTLVFFIIISIPAYMIYKYGFNGYLEKKRERRNKRFARAKKLFNSS